MAEDQDVYTVKEVAERLGLSRGFAFQAVRDGRIPAVRCGRRWLIPKKSYDDYLASAKVRGSDGA